MPETFEYGFQLPDGSRIIHGDGVFVKDAYPPELGIPGQLNVFSPGHSTDPNHSPCFCGPQGVFNFDVHLRMPRHVHMSPRRDSKGGHRYIVEKILVLNGVAIVELSGEVYVIPPNAMVLIGAGVPHTWTACPPGLDVCAELGLSLEERDGEGEVVSKGRFTAVYEYEDATSFYPTEQTRVLKNESEYQRCDDLHSIKIPAFTVEELKKTAWFVWGREARKL